MNSKTETLLLWLAYVLVGAVLISAIWGLIALTKFFANY